MAMGIILMWEVEGKGSGFMCVYVFTNGIRGGIERELSTRFPNFIFNLEILVMFTINTILWVYFDCQND